MYLLLDECCAKSLVAVAERMGHTAQRTIEIGELGRGARDRAIFDFAMQVGAVVVTVNRGDFVDLALRARRHTGVIILPSLGREKLGPLFEAALAVSESAFTVSPGAVLEIDAAGRITIFRTD